MDKWRSSQLTNQHQLQWTSTLSKSVALYISHVWDTLTSWHWPFTFYLCKLSTCSKHFVGGGDGQEGGGAICQQVWRLCIQSLVSNRTLCLGLASISCWSWSDSGKGCAIRRRGDRDHFKFHNIPASIWLASRDTVPKQITLSRLIMAARYSCTVLVSVGTRHCAQCRLPVLLSGWQRRPQRWVSRESISMSNAALCMCA